MGMGMVMGMGMEGLQRTLNLLILLFFARRLAPTIARLDTVR